MALLLAATLAGAAMLPAPGLVCAPAFTEPTTKAPPYYAIELVSTGRLPGTREAAGTTEVRFPRSPFAVAVAPSGEYVHELAVRVEGLRTPPGTVHAVWITTPSLDQVVYQGVLDEDGTLHASTGWNKFLVVITREAADGEPGARWSGPIVLRGMSRSGRMHTMAGHGPFQAEPCARYGY